MTRFALLALPILALPLCLAAAPAMPDRSADTLRPIVACLGAGDFRPYEVKRLPAGVGSRTVLLPGRQMQVKLADGYGMQLYTPRGRLFAELSIELAPPQAFVANRQALRAQLQAYADHHPQGAVPLEDVTLDGVQRLAVRQTSFDIPGPMAYLAFLHEASSLMASAQWVKPAPPARAFADLAGYEAMRLSAEQLLVDCMLARRP